MNLIKRGGLPVLSMVLTCLFPCMFMFCLNADEAKFSHVFPMFWVFLLTAAVIFGIMSLLLRNMSRSAVMTDLAMLVIMNFTMVSDGIKKLIPGFRSMILLAVAAVVLLGLLILILQKKPNLGALCGIISLTFGVLILVNVFTAIPTLISQATFRMPPPGPHDTASNMEFRGDKKNVYYFLFDEYGGSENLKHYLDYDNEEFLTALEERGFSVSRTSKNTESPWTVTLIPNILNLDYVTSDREPINNRIRFLEDPAMFRMFRQNGYEINLINQDNFLGSRGTNVLTSGQREETIADYIYHNSIFPQVPKVDRLMERHVLHMEPNSARASLENVRNAMESCHEHVGKEPTLTMGYVISPHDPFVCDRNGDPLPPEVSKDWTTTDHYFEKLLYTNDMILTTVDNILAKDPDAVILLQADHGSRQPGHLVDQFGGPWFDGEIENPMMASVLNCVRVPGGSPDIEGDTCINAARKTFNAALGTDFDLLEVPPMYEIPKEYMPKEPKPSEPPKAPSEEMPPRQPAPQAPQQPGEQSHKGEAPREHGSAPAPRGGKAA